MKITNIKLNKNGKYVVTIDNEKYNLYQDTILKYLLFSKKEIDNTLFENIIKDNNFYDAYYKIIKFVSIRLRTENEIRKKLNTLFILKKDQDKIINKLKKQGYLNDELYIKSYINDKINLSLEGPEKVKRELLKNGFKEEDILKYLCLFEDINEERINKIINKKLKANHNLSKKMFIVKVGNDLRNLGYQYLKYYGEPFLECANCGLTVKRANNKQKYCNSCYESIHLKQRVDSVMRYRKS